MIAHVCASTGWTWDYVAENIDLPRMKHLGDYWAQHPPMHILMASYVGFKPQAMPSENDEQGDIAEALNALGGDTLSEDEFNELLRAKGMIA